MSCFILSGTDIFLNSAIFVDAKDDRETVICASSKDGVVRQTKGTVSHYSMVEQPGDEPLGFFVPETSTGIYPKTKERTFR